MSSPQMGDSPRAPHSQQVSRVPDPAKISTNRGGQIPAVPIKPQGRVYALRGDLGSGSGFLPKPVRSEEHTSELQSLILISYAVFGLKKKKPNRRYNTYAIIL